eukprot:558005-Alexandrium_andersonii.AAC.1
MPRPSQQCPAVLAVAGVRRASGIARRAFAVLQQCCAVARPLPCRAVPHAPTCARLGRSCSGSGPAFSRASEGQNVRASA